MAKEMERYCQRLESQLRERILEARSKEISMETRTVNRFSRMRIKKEIAMVL